MPPQTLSDENSVESNKAVLSGAAKDTHQAGDSWAAVLRLADAQIRHLVTISSGTRGTRVTGSSKARTHAFLIGIPNIDRHAALANCFNPEGIRKSQAGNLALS
ncbi:hypothetical protein PABG_11594 [Paracoccidioides brasiliensis Pb03]|nr:hypothetical protein PABG_11594 [Paracoccidioides brasiliensis Pb03]